MSIIHSLERPYTKIMKLVETQRCNAGYLISNEKTWWSDGYHWLNLGFSLDWMEFVTKVKQETLNVLKDGLLHVINPLLYKQSLYV